jgi:hypothetical protein
MTGVRILATLVTETCSLAGLLCCWPPAILGYVLHLLVSETDVRKEPIVAINSTMPLRMVRLQSSRSSSFDTTAIQLPDGLRCSDNMRSHLMNGSSSRRAIEEPFQWLDGSPFYWRRLCDLSRRAEVGGCANVPSTLAKCPYAARSFSARGRNGDGELGGDRSRRLFAPRCDGLHGSTRLLLSLPAPISACRCRKGAPAHRPC